ncbi:hypothetical protein BC936DRAFT_141759 [Jimgerdemannia flammicorona]|uniref:Mannose-P-dolichol utilization defect 1 protein homolog n=1 Tax=Jimgerdemannia flammicorona TaxID=994334 RepID=A0A433DFS9_9FUNG|nr:hypothetical protein BC936DRAFT_141759 [Jimgerdemannia flammicorona]
MPAHSFSTLLFLLTFLATQTSQLPIPYEGYFPRKNLLPPPLRDPLVALIDEKCYTSLIENFNLTDLGCIKYAISKALGFGIVLGGAIVKIPQILTIISSSSAEGLSLAAYYLESLSCVITLVYNYRQGNPFSTYGEVLFLSLQNIAITLLILAYARRQSALVASAVAILLVAKALLSPDIVGPGWMQTLYAATIPINLASKVPQIYTNWSNGSTGKLSAFAVLNYFLGSTARVFTTITELDDPLVLAGNVLASLFNGILAFQLIYYWRKNKGIPPQVIEEVKKAD